MRFKSILVLTAALACAAAVLASCSRTVVVDSPGTKSTKVGHGPPPHAPAHGYRRKVVKGVEMVYDSDCGVYVVVGFEDHYYHRGRYFRFGNGQWEVSVALDSGWKPVRKGWLPPGLRGKYKAKQKAHPGRGLGLEKKEKKW